jgi:hypothetical protein
LHRVGDQRLWHVICRVVHEERASNDWLQPRSNKREQDEFQ